MCEIAALYKQYPEAFTLKPNPEGTKKERLFDAYLKQPGLKPKQYKAMLYPKDYNGTGYEVLRNGLQDELLKSVSRIDFEKNPQILLRTKKILLLNRDVLALRILIGSGHYQKSLAKADLLFRQRLKMAEETEFYEFQQFFNHLCMHRAALTCNREEFFYYRSKSIQLIKYMAIQEEIKALQLEWSLIVARSKTLNNSEIIDFESRFKDFKRKMSQVELDSIPIRHETVALELKILEARKDYDEVAERTIEFLEKEEESLSPGRVVLLLGLIISAYSNLNEAREVEKWYAYSKKYLIKGTYNWFAISELVFCSRISSLNFDEAFELLQQVLSAKGLNRLPEFKNDIWKLYESYLKLAYELKLWKNDVKDLLNMDRELFLPNKDKVGLNVSVLILDYLYKLKDGSLEGHFDMLDSFKRYISRYLKSKENERTRLFMTMLVKVVDADFIPSEVEKKTRKHFERIKTMDRNFNVNLGGNEIIPYEVLWDWVLKKLKELALTRKY